MNSNLVQVVKKHLRDEVGVDPEKLDDFIKESSGHLKNILMILDDAIDEGDFEEIIVNAHKLRGALCNVGLADLSLVAKSIEITAASNTPAYLCCYVMRLQKELKVFFQ
ncbi:Hpt domain-containing protein [Maridesulfovibrio zosterae]|uniref:Hpt domain-containing protein n=1 Tax=Maridesulfovibrio zosterae TaxID=82171 RepID=UPI00040A4D6E|nr:Hpt domain-containing protein [Maridesulfovibrio zosterae]